MSDHTSSLSDVVSLIEDEIIRSSKSSPGKVVLVIISGRLGLGKTYLAKALESQLQNSFRICTDSYLPERSQRIQGVLEIDELIDCEQLCEAVYEILEQPEREFSVKRYSHITGNSKTIKGCKFVNNSFPRVLILDGGLALCDFGQAHPKISIVLDAKTKAYRKLLKETLVSRQSPLDDLEERLNQIDRLYRKNRQSLIKQANCVIDVSNRYNYSYEVTISK